jgi:hypothetical protein
MGRIIKAENLSTPEITDIDISDQPASIYILKVTLDERIRTYTLSLQ